MALAGIGWLALPLVLIRPRRKFALLARQREPSITAIRSARLIDVPSTASGWSSDFPHSWPVNFCLPAGASKRVAAFPALTTARCLPCFLLIAFLRNIFLVVSYVSCDRCSGAEAIFAIHAYGPTSTSRPERPNQLLQWTICPSLLMHLNILRMFFSLLPPAPPRTPSRVKPKALHRPSEVDLDRGFDEALPILTLFRTLHSICQPRRPPTRLNCRHQRPFLPTRWLAAGERAAWNVIYGDQDSPQLMSEYQYPGRRVGGGPSPTNILDVIHEPQ
ncbi:hypothetical protein BD311DRAFT_758103 [Dichomitus squalens]|uniref:Uncharacterized protein n=1 Tax=Dichomitus squalens TaxID=114155 RepID=A0A4V2K0E9_9APHY|nr:hypothetical protein BD311DRAFT_758103 [Dichomitus squalens]TBU62289.1 hypothetical protein BD310DRAFT_919079 [Dichomitus squalens]